MEIASTSAPVFVSFSAEGDVGLGDDADEPAALDDGQPPDLVAGHELERLFEVIAGLDADEVP